MRESELLRSVFTFKGTTLKPRDFCPKGHLMAGANVYQEDLSLKCRTCTHERQKRYRENRRLKKST